MLLFGDGRLLSEETLGLTVEVQQVRVSVCGFLAWRYR